MRITIVDERGTIAFFVAWHLQMHGVETETFTNPEAFYRNYQPGGWILLGESGSLVRGPEVLQAIRERGWSDPVVRYGPAFSEAGPDSMACPFPVEDLIQKFELLCSPCPG